MKPTAEEIHIGDFEDFEALKIIFMTSRYQLQFVYWLVETLLKTL